MSTQVILISLQIKNEISMINVAIHNSPCCSQQWQKPEDPPLCCASWIELQIMADRGLPIETNVFFKICNGHMMNWTNSVLVSHTFRLLTHLKENLHFLDFHLPLPQLFLPGALAVFVGVSGRSVLVPLSTLTASSWRIKKKKRNVNCVEYIHYIYVIHTQVTGYESKQLKKYRVAIHFVQRAAFILRCTATRSTFH